MEALILAAGFGSRLLKPLNSKPKSLLKISKKTILYYLVDKIQKNKINKLHIVVGFKKKMIIDYLIKNFSSKIEINFIYNKYYKKRGNIYSVCLAESFLNKDLVIFNADIVLPKNILNRFILDPQKNLFLTNQKKFINDDDIVYSYTKNKVVNNIFIKESKNNQKNLVPSAGVVKMEKKTIKSFLSIIKKMDFNKIKYSENGYQDLIKKFKFKVCISRKKIIEVDTRRDYKNLKKIINYDKSYTC
tara:strand:+ start:1143 stop:1877 length:735 start_codon:yes stop_codon:yes gene_type:complete